MYFVKNNLNQVDEYQDKACKYSYSRLINQMIFTYQ